MTQSSTPKRSAWRMRRGFRRNVSGATAVEFGMLAMPFFFLVFAIIETGVVIGAGVLLDNAVKDVARQVMTGQIQSSDVDPKTFKAKICDEVDILMDCAKVKVDLRTFPAFGAIPSNIPMKLASVDDTGFCFDPGAQDSITVLRAFYEWPWKAGFLQKLSEGSNGNALLFSIAPFMNEPFGTDVSPNSNCS
jgi:Flp pilus assembly protein TadG